MYSRSAKGRGKGDPNRNPWLAKMGEGVLPPQISGDTVTLLTYIEIFKYKLSKIYVCLMVFKATFNKILVISWRSVLFVEETGGPRENHRPVASC